MRDKCAAVKALEEMSASLHPVLQSRAQDALSAPCPLAEEARVLRRVAEAYLAQDQLMHSSIDDTWINRGERVAEELEAALAEARAKGVLK
jgi:hypothetical protein